jgi:hypothetical protein
MTTEYVEVVGRLAYLWGWPLVNNLNRALAVANLPEPGRIGGVIPASPPGQISMLTDYIDAAEHFVTCPNQDTVYGAGFQRLDQTAVVVQVPDFGAGSIPTNLRIGAPTHSHRLERNTEQSAAFT